jgi:3-deoxy-manno-octulosonate cytidylyltransferase (CMP-KDO synthetase)
MPTLAIIVPARLESTRFPRKLLHRIGGKPLLLHVAERIRDQTPELPLTFAVDHSSLQEVLEGSGFSAVMTRADHPSGSDRLAEANLAVGAAFVINVQADEPLISRAQILELGRLIQTGVDMATFATPFRRAEDFFNPNQVKVVLDAQGRALYFSRAPIPFPRDQGRELGPDFFRQHPVLRHLGLYAYTRDFLSRFTRLPPGKLEQVEKLEQLRALENGYKIAVGLTDEATIGVDVPEDAEKYEAYLAQGGEEGRASLS